MCLKRIFPVGLLGSCLATAVLVGSSPVTVSPGDPSRFVLIADTCPTFSWAGTEGAKGYELVVYRLDDEGQGAEPVLKRQFLGSASSWTPALESCLDRGDRYAWSVRALGTGEASDWSTPGLFQVAAGTTEDEFRSALAVVERYLADGAAGASSGGHAAERLADPAPVTDEPVISKLSAPGNTSVLSESGALSVDGVVVAEGLRVDCPQGRWAGNGHCYLIMGSIPGSTWSEALDICLANGGEYLATLTSPEEEAFVRSLFVSPHSTLDAAWIGFSDARSEDVWEWTTGEVAVTGNDTIYTNWAANEPNDAGSGEDCAMLIPTGWNDADCFFRGSSSQIVCEREH